MVSQWLCKAAANGKRKKGAKDDDEGSEAGSTAAPSAAASVGPQSSTGSGWMALALPASVAVKEEAPEISSEPPQKSARKSLKAPQSAKKWSPCPICGKGPDAVKACWAVGGGSFDLK